MRFDGGWIKAHRSLLSHWVGEDLLSLGLWVRLISMANYKPSKILRKGKFITLERGQLLTTVAELKGESECGRAVIERLLNLMVADGMITQNTSNEGRIITICNYSDYQDIEIDDQQWTNNEPTMNQQHNSNEPAHSKEGKNNKKEKKERRTLLSVESSALTVVSSQIGNEWLEYALSEMPWMADKPAWTPSRFAEDLERVKRSTKLNDEGLRAILAFVRKDDFWRDKACSPLGLLKKNSAGLRKIDNILPRLRTKGDRERELLTDWDKNPVTEEELRGW